MINIHKNFLSGGAILLLFLFGTLNIWSSGCASTINSNDDIKSKMLNDSLSVAYLASGCFWCVEAIYEHTVGVVEVYNGYAGGHAQNPTYESSNTGRTGHAESVKILYDSTKIDFGTLIDIYFVTQNIEQVNGQGPDNGSQYRSIIFYQNDYEYDIINTKIADLQSNGLKVAAEVMPFEKFWMGEEYHQDYEKRHPNHPYIQRVSKVRLNQFKKAFPDLVK